VPDEPDSLVLRMLRSISGQLTRVSEDVQDLKLRMTSLETAEASHYASVAGRLDRVEVRLGRFERRPELSDGASLES